MMQNYGCSSCQAKVLHMAPGEEYECPNCGAEWIRDSVMEGAKPAES